MNFIDGKNPKIFTEIGRKGQTWNEQRRKGKGSFVPGDSADLFETLGYEGYKTGNEYVIYDSDKIIKVTNALYDESKAIEKGNYLLEEYKSSYKSYALGNGGLEQLFNINAIEDEIKQLLRIKKVS